MDNEDKYTDLIKLASKLQVNDISEYILKNPLNLDSSVVGMTKIKKYQESNKKP